MHRVTISMLALSMMTAPALLEAQTPRMQQRPGAMGLAGGAVAERLLTHRDALGLSPDQVARIRQVQTQLEEQNRPLAEQLRAGMQQRGAGMQQQQQRREAMQQERDSMRQQHAAMRDRMQQLTPEQRAQVRQRAQTGQRVQARQETRQRAQARQETRQRVQARQDTQSAATRTAPVRRPAALMRRPAAAAGTGAGMSAALPEELRPVMQQMRQNTARATEQLMAILAPAQRATLRTLRAGR